MRDAFTASARDEPMNRAPVSMTAIETAIDAACSAGLFLARAWARFRPEDPMLSALIVEDDGEIADLIELTLQMQWPGGSCSRVGDGQSAVTLARSQDPDLILLDLGLPTMDGFDVIKEIRRFSAVPLVVVTGRGEEVERVRGLELGADDYVVKPFSPLELLARTKAILRRCHNQIELGSGQPNFDDGYLAIDFARHQAAIERKRIYLTATEFRVLAFLVQNRGFVVSHRSLLAKVWGHEYEDATDYLRVYVRRLREKIEPDPDVPRYLVTERGVGYRFVQSGGRDAFDRAMT